MYEEGDTPKTATCGLEIYQWKTTRETLFYIPVDGDTEKYAFSSYSTPEWIDKYKPGPHC